MEIDFYDDERMPFRTEEERKADFWEAVDALNIAGIPEVNRG